jgi:hypothetical protein
MLESIKIDNREGQVQAGSRNLTARVFRRRKSPEAGFPAAAAPGLS